MKIFVLTGVYWPDTASVAQILADLCEDLHAEGHQVTVLTSRYAYEDPSIAYPNQETYRGVNIERIRSTRYDKSKILNRLLNFLSFNLLTFWKLLGIKSKEYDLMIGLTVPPLVSFFGVYFARKKKIPFVYWAMDMQPELAIASNLMKKDAFFAKLMTSMGNYIMRRSDGIVALDKYMAQYIQKRCKDAAKVVCVPVWPVMSEIYTGERMANPFRIANGFQDKIVIMYSGNHSYVHPLDTLLEAALALKDDPRFLFVSIGAGVRVKDIEQYAAAHNLKNIVRLPYQPREMIHLSLGASDLQVVILGEGQVGYTHPSKVYGSLFVAKPLLYIGPTPSHVTDIINDCPGNLSVNHGQHQALVQQLLQFATLSPNQQQAIGEQNRNYAMTHFSPEKLRKQMLNEVLSFAKTT